MSEDPGNWSNDEWMEWYDTELAPDSQWHSATADPGPALGEDEPDLRLDIEKLAIDGVIPESVAEMATAFHHHGTTGPLSSFLTPPAATFREAFARLSPEFKRMLHDWFNEPARLDPDHWDNTPVESIMPELSPIIIGVASEDPPAAESRPAVGTDDDPGAGDPLHLDDSPWLPRSIQPTLDAAGPAPGSDDWVPPPDYFPPLPPPGTQPFPSPPDPDTAVFDGREIAVDADGNDEIGYEEEPLTESPDPEITASSGGSLLTRAPVVVGIGGLLAIFLLAWLAFGGGVGSDSPDPTAGAAIASGSDSESGSDSSAASDSDSDEQSGEVVAGDGKQVIIAGHPCDLVTAAEIAAISGNSVLAGEKTDDSSWYTCVWHSMPGAYASVEIRVQKHPNQVSAEDEALKWVERSADNRLTPGNELIVESFGFGIVEGYRIAHATGSASSPDGMSNKEVTSPIGYFKLHCADPQQSLGIAIQGSVFPGSVDPHTAWYGLIPSTQLLTDTLVGSVALVYNGIAGLQTPTNQEGAGCSPHNFPPTD